MRRDSHWTERRGVWDTGGELGTRIRGRGIDSTEGPYVGFDCHDGGFALRKNPVFALNDNRFYSTTNVRDKRSPKSFFYEVSNSNHNLASLNER